MSVTAEALREIHRIHRQLNDLHSRLLRGPKRIRAAEVNLDRLNCECEQSQESLKQVRMAGDQKQLQLKSAEDRILDMQRKRNACSSNREYQALVEQIAADEMATSVLTDEILEILEKIDDHQKFVTVTGTSRDKAIGELEKLKSRTDAEKNSLEVELGRLTDELVEAEKVLPKDFRVQYDRVVKARGEEALAGLDGECCGGCYQTITPQMMDDLTLSRPVFCKTCGRLLYLPERG